MKICNEYMVNKFEPASPKKSRACFCTVQGQLNPSTVRSCVYVACRFYGELEDGDTRFVTTNSMYVGPSTVIEFELVTSCHHVGRTAQYLDEEQVVRLEYSTDHGMSWSLVEDGCWPPGTCTHYHPASIYQLDQFPRWKRITIVLPLATWCVLLRRFRGVGGRLPRSRARFCSKDFNNLGRR